MSSLYHHLLLDADAEYALAVRARRAILARQQQDVAEQVAAEQPGDQDAIEQLILLNQRLVAKIARRRMYMAGTLDFEDLASAGNLGLMVAIKKYDPERGVRFATFATWWVRAYITRQCYDHGSVISISNAASQRFWKSRHTETAMASQNGQAPTASEIAEEIGIDISSLHSLRRAHDAISLDCDSDDDSDDARPFIDLVSSDIPDPDAALIDQDLAGEALDYIKQLHPTVCNVLLDFFGFNDERRSMSPAEIGRKHGMDAERARRLIVNGTESVRRAMSQPRLL